MRLFVLKTNYIQCAVLIEVYERSASSLIILYEELSNAKMRGVIFYLKKHFSHNSHRSLIGARTLKLEIGF